MIGDDDKKKQISVEAREAERHREIEYWKNCNSVEGIPTRGSRRMLAQHICEERDNPFSSISLQEPQLILKTRLYSSSRSFEAGSCSCLEPVAVLLFLPLNPSEQEFLLKFHSGR